MNWRTNLLRLACCWLCAGLINVSLPQNTFASVAGSFHTTERGVWVYLNPNTGRFWTMDSFAGNNSDPLSLHKYLYCHANPVNGWDPTGHENLPSLNASIGIMLGVGALMTSPIFANAPGNAEEGSDPAYTRNDADMIVNIIGGHIVGKVVGVS